MKIHGLTLEQLSAAAAELNLQLYNVREEKTHIACVLRPTANTAPEYRKQSYSGRRVWACSWRAHRDWMYLLFDQNQNAKIVSCLATYDGYDSFLLEYPRTARINVGSLMQPLAYEDAHQ